MPVVHTRMAAFARFSCASPATDDPQPMVCHRLDERTCRTDERKVVRRNVGSRETRLHHSNSKPDELPPCLFPQCHELTRRPTNEPRVASAPVSALADHEVLHHPIQAPRPLRRLLRLPADFVQVGKPLTGLGPT